MNNQKTVAFFPAHPSQLWLMRPVAEKVAQFARVMWFLRDKDCTVDLARILGMEYEVVSIAKTGLLGNGVEMLLAIPKLIRLTLRHNVDMWFTKYGAGNIAASALGRKSVSFNDDDADIIPLIAITSYMFAKKVFVPDVARMGRYDKYAVRYPGYHELYYLHPNRFAPDPSVYGDLKIKPGSQYAVIRLSGLAAHHDVGVKGLKDELLAEIIRVTPENIRIFITSETPLTPEFEPYRMPVSPDRIHHVLAFAEFFVGDSQTMGSECAVLGTPAIRINDFMGRISVINDMEERGLTFGFKPDQEKDLLNQLKDIINMKDRKKVFSERRIKMLAEKTDPVPEGVNLIKKTLLQNKGKA